MKIKIKEELTDFGMEKIVYPIYRNITVKYDQTIVCYRCYSICWIVIQNIVREYYNN